jgi:hypothetical protein
VITSLFLKIYVEKTCHLLEFSSVALLYFLQLSEVIFWDIM